jgi:hypothetical protein
MGASPSKPVCFNPAFCEPLVAVVKQRCEKVGKNVLETILQRTFVAIAGPDFGNRISKLYDPHPWDELQPELSISGFKNYEGFVEGASNNDCVKCSCYIAAAEIIAECEKLDPQLSDAVVAAADPSLLPLNVRREMDLAPAPIRPVSKWQTLYHPGLFDNSNTSIASIIRNTNATNNANNASNNETFINRETFINSNDDKIYKFVKDAIQERHDKFHDISPTFQQDCKSSSYYSMDKFITEEKKMLDTLFAYYTNFVSSYEGLYLHKEAVIKIINGKLDELEKIQSKIDSYKTNLHVDNRKNNYQNSNYEYYSTLRKYMLILYYSLFVLYLIFSNFLREKQYTNKKILLVLAIYLLIPIVLSFAINLTYEGYIYFLETNNIKEDTKSYVDIIKA